MSTENEPLLATVRRDLASAKGWRLLLVVAMVLWLAFQWGFGNDALLPVLVANAAEFVDDFESATGGTTFGLVMATLAGGLVGFAFWTLTQLLDALIVLAGVKHLPAIMDRMSRYLRGKGWVKPWSELRWGTRWAIAYAAGASAVVLVDVLATNKPGIRGRRSMIASAVLLSSATVGVVSAAVVLVALIALRIPATEDEAEIFIRFARHPLTWIVIIGVVVGIGHLRSDRAPNQAQDATD